MKKMRKLLCMGMVLSTIAGMLPVGVSAMNGTAEITPIESDIAKKFWVTPSSDSGYETSKLATDENVNTAWVADNNEAGHWLKLDLGGTYDNVRKTEVVLPTIMRYISIKSKDRPMDRPGTSLRIGPTIPLYPKGLPICLIKKGPAICA